ncbi:MAG: FeoA family protein [Chloroflexota bacterium]|nr:FeoA family protein [Chloroflexota bacterium]
MPTKSLSQMKPAEKGAIVRVKGGAGTRSVRRRILDMGVVSGAQIEVQRVAPLGDPIEIKIKGYNLTLRKEEAANIEVEVA